MQPNLPKILATTAIATALGAAGALAQTAAPTSAFDSQTAASAANENLQKQIATDAERHTKGFGNASRPEGWSGNFALRFNKTSGNTDTVDVGAGTDLNFRRGKNGVELMLNYTYGETGNVTTTRSTLYSLEYDRDLNPQLFGFARAQGTVAAFTTFKSDNFASFGLGYRIVDTPRTQWSVQGGPGYRFADYSLDANKSNVREAGFGVSSNLTYRINPSTTLTNDTDVIASSSDTAVNNDLAVSVALSNALALRTSLLTGYHSQPAPGYKNTDNTLGVAVVYKIR